MGRDHRTPQERENAFRAWWNSLDAEQRAHEVKSGHVRLRLPDPESRAKTPNQRKTERRRARGKR